MKPTICRTKQCRAGVPSLRCLAVAAIVFAALALASGELESRLVEPATPLYSKVVRIFGFSALAVGFTLIALIVYAMVFAYR